MPVLGEIIGWEILVPIALIALLFGSSKIPQLARSLGQAQHEFKKGITEGHAEGQSEGQSETAKVDEPAPPVAAPAPVDEPKSEESA